MKKIKVMSVFGTRPEAVKMAPLVLELQKCEQIENVVVVTAQHRQLLDSVMDLFGIKADYDLDLMKERQTLSSLTSTIMTEMTKVLEQVKPDIVLVHGDTTTSSITALAAFYLGIKVGHVEAGLRTFDKNMPFPEELNRRITDFITDIYFAPTAYNKDTLVREGIDESRIFVTGNTAIDALATTATIPAELPIHMQNDGNRLILVTAHRRDNPTNSGENPIEEICKALLRVVQDFADVEIFFPVHPNPAVREIVYAILGNNSRIHLTDPCTAAELQCAMRKCYMVMSDSGGLQEEAPSFGKPIIVMRKETERPEGIHAGISILAGTNQDIIYNSAKRLLTDPNAYAEMSAKENPYGDGKASKRIVEAIISFFK